LLKGKSDLFNPLMLGRRAKRIRIEKQLSIESLAQQADVNKNTVVRFEKGLSTRMETIYNICQVLDISPFHLIEGKLIKGKDYDIKIHKERHLSSASKRVPRMARLQTDEIQGSSIGDLNYRLPGGMLSGKVLEISTKSQKRSHTGEELLFCLTGTVGVEISDVKAVLHKGDAIFFWGTEPHIYYNADEKKKISVALSVVNEGE
jgi:transcriptional regulator with XRE-family HTH domain